MVGRVRRSGGRILLDGVPIGSWPSYRRARAGVATVPQGREIFAGLTVGENLLLGAKGKAIHDGADLADEVCALFPVLRAVWRRRGGDLSGGQQQQLAIGRALMGRPRLLLLDEPTEGVQPSIVRAIEAAIVSLKSRTSILLVEQYVDFARSLADRFVVLSRGAVVAEGDVSSMDHDALRGFLAI